METKAIFFAVGGLLMLVCQFASLYFLRKNKKWTIHPILAMSPVILMSLHPIAPEAIRKIFMEGIGHKALITAMQWAVLWGAVFFWNKNRKAAMCNMTMLPLTIIDVLFHIIFKVIN